MSGLLITAISISVISCIISAPFFIYFVFFDKTEKEDNWIVWLLLLLSFVPILNIMSFVVVLMTTSLYYVKVVRVRRLSDKKDGNYRFRFGGEEVIVNEKELFNQ